MRRSRFAAATATALFAIVSASPALASSSTRVTHDRPMCPEVIQSTQRVAGAWSGINGSLVTASPVADGLSWVVAEGVSLRSVQIESFPTRVGGAVISSAVAIPGAPTGVAPITNEEDVVVRFIAAVECRVHVDDAEDLFDEPPVVDAEIEAPVEEAAAIEEIVESEDVVTEPAPKAEASVPVERVRVVPTFSPAMLTALRVLGGAPAPVAGASRGLALPYEIAMSLAG